MVQGPVSNVVPLQSTHMEPLGNYRAMMSWRNKSDLLYLNFCVFVYVCVCVFVCVCVSFTNGAYRTACHWWLCTVLSHVMVVV